MFSKTSTQSFVYDLVNVFIFPETLLKRFMRKNEIQKCFLFQNLTDTDSTSLFFIFICTLFCFINEKTAKSIIF